MKYLYKILCLFIPRKKWRKSFRQYYKSRINWKKIQKRYDAIINTLKTKEKIKVVFLVWENCKWSYDSLYHKLKMDSRFQPLVVIKTENHYTCNLEKNEEFFKNKGYDYVVVASLNEFKQHCPDIVFYEQPWFVMDGGFSPKNISKKCLCLYVPYGIETDVITSLLKQTSGFYKCCYCSFVLNKFVSQKLNKIPGVNALPTGHPKMEAYLEPIKCDCWKSEQKTRIIFAPHHSFANSILKWATYEWSGEYLLELAKKHLDTTEWVFKPHPRFYLCLIEEFGQEYADKVFQDWAKISTLCDTGNYFDLFKTADLLISDCGSFRTEWLPTKKPYLYLVSNYKGCDSLTAVEQHFCGGYYFAKNIQDIDKYFKLLVQDKKDPLKEKRMELLKEIPMNASEIIYNYIKKIVR